MSFIIQGIDLPEKNEGLYFYTFNGKVEIVHPLDACEVEHTGAQAIQIPKDHGRLGDLDYLYDRFKANNCPDENVYRLIREEPTILEAEGE